MMRGRDEDHKTAGPQSHMGTINIPPPTDVITLIALLLPLGVGFYRSTVHSE